MFGSSRGRLLTSGRADRDNGAWNQPTGHSSKYDRKPRFAWEPPGLVSTLEPATSRFLVKSRNDQNALA